MRITVKEQIEKLRKQHVGATFDRIWINGRAYKVYPSGRFERRKHEDTLPVRATVRKAREVRNDG